MVNRRELLRWVSVSALAPVCGCTTDRNLLSASVPTLQSIDIINFKPEAYEYEISVVAAGEQVFEDEGTVPQSDGSDGGITTIEAPWMNEPRDYEIMLAVSQIETVETSVSELQSHQDKTDRSCLLLTFAIRTDDSIGVFAKPASNC
ncbi:hypothetical protein SAMN04488691_10425 [Haloferax larsenii]|uniref:Uncharacterized protein n=1 Tax=Haloferax larsenii TaxID=302484 RepID=A0A1H7PA56_HALLR|nr:hypothetical protein SAMN04488691_10425 [Haloferax larsenii]